MTASQIISHGYHSFVIHSETETETEAETPTQAGRKDECVGENLYLWSWFRGKICVKQCFCNKKIDIRVDDIDKEGQRERNEERKKGEKEKLRYVHQAATVTAQSHLG